MHSFGRYADTAGQKQTLLRWVAAASIVTGVHAAALWIGLNWKPAETTPTESPPAVMIDLAALAVAPDAPQQDVAPGPQMTEATSEPRRLPSPEKPVEEKAADLQEPEAKNPELQKNDQADAVLMTVLPQPRPKIEQDTPNKEHSGLRKPMEKASAPRTTAPPAAHARRSDVAAAPTEGFANASSASATSWRSEVVARLSRYKRYPGGASASGTAIVAFTISRSGALVGTHLARSSGDRLLDKEAVELPQRASPFPPPPHGIGHGGAVALSVPVRFNR